MACSTVGLLHSQVERSPDTPIVARVAVAGGCPGAGLLSIQAGGGTLFACLDKVP